MAISIDTENTFGIYISGQGYTFTLENILGAS